MTRNLYELGIQQGSLIHCCSLSEETKEAIIDGRTSSSRKKPISCNHWLLILSQDCDLSNKDDKHLEVITIKKIKKSQQSVQRARSYRTLQLFHQNEYFELKSELISVIEKEKILHSQSSKLEILNILDESNLQLIIDWRVGKYNRKPLPDNFNNIFLGYLRSNNGLSEYLEQNRETVFDIYVYLEPNDQKKTEEYKVTLVALVDQNCDDQKFECIRSFLLSHWEILHDADNCLKFGQVDPAYAPTSLDINQEIAARLSDFTFLDNYYFTKITLNYLCYDPLPETVDD